MQATDALLAFVLVAIFACTRENPPPAATSTSVERSGVSDDDAIAALTRGLWDAMGSFTASHPAAGDFHGDRAPFEALTEYADSSADRAHALIRNLVACMSDTAPANARYRDQAISRGMMCYIGLLSLASYEPTDESGELTGEWVGYVPIDATAEQLRAAQAAWQELVNTDGYSLL